MRLGIVMTGAGAHAAAAVGVLDALRQREIEPQAVCGVQGGAWPAALFAAGLDQETMHAALLQAGRSGRSLLLPGASVRALVRGRAQALCSGKRMEKLLIAQVGQRVLSLCPRPAVFLCRTLRTGRPVIFSTRAFEHEPGAMLTMQVSLGFAARAALSMPPLLPVMHWMGSAILPLADVALACRLLLAMEVHRVLVIAPQLSPRTEPDALDLAAASFSPYAQELDMGNMAVLRVPMDDGITALSFDQLPACAQCGRRAAESRLDELLGEMGMATCRVLAFRRERA